MAWPQQQEMRQDALNKAYDVQKAFTQPKKPVVVAETRVETIEVKKPDIYDQGWVMMRTFVPDFLLPVILIAGLYAVFHKPVNIFLTTVFGFNFEDLRQTVKRRKERDEELKGKNDNRS